ncbi:hypothetical protein Syncc8109_2149 [Synechococcus sp. WH 8109]|nr:hypothetical protein Syncc8109_2149 [Synechococcus sp. WH 8109]
MSGKRLGLDLRLQKRFGCGLLTFNRSKSSFHFFSELLARFPCNTLDLLFHTAIRPDGEANGLLGHRET